MAEPVTNNDPKKNPAPPAPHQQPIAVRELQFSRANGVEVPISGPHGGARTHMASIVAGEKHGGFTEIEYRPWLRHHRVSWWKEGRPTPEDEKSGRKRPAPIVFNIPEAWALWVE